jgi:hypothetical protein
MTQMQLLRWYVIELEEQVRSVWGMEKSIHQGSGIPSEFHPLKA